MSADCPHKENDERIRGDGTIVVVCVDCGLKIGELAE
jgi:hypothetical protein